MPNQRRYPLDLFSEDMQRYQASAARTERIARRIALAWAYRWELMLVLLGAVWCWGMLS